MPHDFAKRGPHIWLCAWVLACTGCAHRSVRIPSSDATPPMAILDVVSKDQVMILTDKDEAPGAIQMGPMDSVVLIALGEDRDGGVKNLTLYGAVTARCADGIRGERTRSGSFLRHSMRKAAPGERAPASKSTNFTLRASDFVKLCGGERLKSARGKAGVRAMNFHGGSSWSPSIEFQFSDSALAVPAPLSKTPLDIPLPALRPTGKPKTSQAAQSPKAGSVGAPARI